ncbi:Metallopeptidase M20 [Saguinus oedipus]|uniref:Metallopeptidase M20 n=1 Tax=Saguinus oedipus TaxID=9490 RepID=A0ABQ9UBE5_SAGOE|nr:Metallopeptidase M20 [Saguinus oedipus]
MTDLILLMGSLVDKRGNILIPGINEAVAAVTEEEHKLYDDIDFDMEEFARDVGAHTLLHCCKKHAEGTRAVTCCSGSAVFVFVE